MPRKKKEATGLVLEDIEKLLIHFALSVPENQTVWKSFSHTVILEYFN